MRDGRRGFPDRVACAGRLDRQRLDDQRPLGRGKAEPRAVCLDKRGTT